MAIGLGQSLRLSGDKNPTVILTDIDADWEKYYDVVVWATKPRSRLDKLLGLELTGADQVLTLDCDTLVFRPLDPIFEYCAGKPLAVQGDTQDAGVWHGACVRQLCARWGRSSIPRFNSGLVYYE